MSSANRGSARHPLDAYYTPDALARALVGTLDLPTGSVVWEPHAGGGAFVRALHAAGHRIYASDLNYEADGLREAGVVAGWAQNALTGWTAPLQRPDWIVGNPPYDNAEAHVRAALATARVGVAFLLRLAFLEGARRRHLFADYPPAEVHVLVERPSFTGQGTDSSAYGWFVWRRGHEGPPTLHWLSWRRREATGG